MKRPRTLQGNGDGIKDFKAKLFGGGIARFYDMIRQKDISSAAPFTHPWPFEAMDRVNALKERLVMPATNELDDSYGDDLLPASLWSHTTTADGEQRPFTEDDEEAPKDSHFARTDALREDLLKRSDALITLFYEWNHQEFVKKPVRETLINLHRSNRDAISRLTEFEAVQRELTRKAQFGLQDLIAKKRMARERASTTSAAAAVGDAAASSRKHGGDEDTYDGGAEEVDGTLVAQRYEKAQNGADDDNEWEGADYGGDMAGVGGGVGGTDMYERMLAEEEAYLRTQQQQQQDTDAGGAEGPSGGTADAGDHHQIGVDEVDDEEVSRYDDARRRRRTEDADIGREHPIYASDDVATSTTQLA